MGYVGPISYRQERGGSDVDGGYAVECSGDSFITYHFDNMSVEYVEF
jgi:hypothetical protein